METNVLFYSWWTFSVGKCQALAVESAYQPDEPSGEHNNKQRFIFLGAGRHF
jgi:hypothetical protein